MTICRKKTEKSTLSPSIGLRHDSAYGNRTDIDTDDMEIEASLVAIVLRTVHRSVTAITSISDQRSGHSFRLIKVRLVKSKASAVASVGYVLRQLNREKNESPYSLP